MSEWIEKAVLGGSMRMAEAMMAAAPTLLVGLLIASVLRFYFGPDGTRRLFGGTTLRSLPQSWAIGMLLPVCSIGVLPVLIEMRRAKLKAGAMSAFALSAPLFNPLSLLYGVTLSRPYVILMFAFGSLIVVTTVGLTWDFISRREPESVEPAIDDEAGDETIIGARRLLAIVIYCCRQLVGRVGAWALLACFGVAVLAAALPWGALGHAMGRDDWMAPARMAAAAIPAYATPMLAMSQLGMMFQHANSPGAAFILLVIGAGVNLGTIGWMSRQYGLRDVVIWFACLMAVVVIIAYAVNRPLIPPGVNPSGHTHAFDIYTNPIHQLDTNSYGFAKRKLAEKFGIVEQICATVFGVMALLGVLFLATGARTSALAKRQQAAMSEANNDKGESLLGYDRIVGSQVVGGTLIIGLITISVVMCFAFYPSPEESLKEISHLKAEALSGALSGDADHAKFWIPRWDQWSRRMEVGAFLRRGTITPYQRAQGFLLRTKLDLLEHELEHPHDPGAMRELVNDVLLTNTRWVRAYQKPFDPSGPLPEIVYYPYSEEEHTHGHGHSHGHSHDHGHHHDAPHGGEILSVEDTRGFDSISNPHLEVMPVRDGTLTIYPLKEQLGKLRPIKQQPGDIVLQLGADSVDEELPMKWNSSDNSFSVALPPTVKPPATVKWSFTNDAEVTLSVSISRD